MATDQHIPESVKYAVERAKQWEQAYQYILTKEENMPSFKHVLENDNLILKNGGSYRLDPCLGILESLTDVSKYTTSTDNLLTSHCFGNNHRLSIPQFNGVYTLTMNTSKVFTKRFSLAVFCVATERGYKDKVYNIVEYILDNYDFTQQDKLFKVVSDSIIGKDIDMYFGLSHVSITDRNDEELVFIYEVDDGLVCSYPHLEEFFGKLDGRPLTEDDLTLYEMVHGRKPLIYNLEEKMKIMLAK